MLHKWGEYYAILARFFFFFDERDEEHHNFVGRLNTEILCPNVLVRN